MTTFVMHHPRGRGLGSCLIAFAQTVDAQTFVVRVNNEISAEAEIVTEHEAREYLLALADRQRYDAYGVGVYLRDQSADSEEAHGLTEHRRQLAAASLSFESMDTPGLVQRPVAL